METQWDTVQDTITVTYPLRKTNLTGSPKGWLVVHIDMASFSEIFDNARWTDENLLVVYHEKSGIVTSLNLSIPLSELQNREQIILEQSNGSIVKIENKEHILQFRNSRSVDKLKYVSLIPVDIYSDQFQALTRFSSILFIIVFITGILLIYRFSVARYKPVHDLLSMLKPGFDGKFSLRSDEFGMIANTMQMTLEEDKQLRQKVQQSGTILKQRLLKQLFYGNMAYDQSAREKLADFGVTFLNPYNSLILVDIELDEEADNEIRDHLIEQLWSAGENENIHIIKDLSGAIGILINQRVNDREKIYESLLIQKQKAEAEMPLFLAIGISGTHTIDDDLRILYKEASKALEFRLVKG